MLYIVLVYLLPFAALFNAACLHNAYFLPLTFSNAFFFMLCLGLLPHNFLFFLFCIMHNAFNLLVFLILCSHLFLSERAMCSQEK